ncbi:transposase [Streptomyces zhihengii]|uniref:transposase n=1 Tax=Streptomyces zhihengii TaxID=1818004 RepID=UPI001FD53428|nr:transposase [Streptomyces zhihengii]
MYSSIVVNADHPASCTDLAMRVRASPLMHYPPKTQLSKLVNSLQDVSARMLRTEYDGHLRRCLWGGHLWSGSYFAGGCGRAPLTVVK